MQWGDLTGMAERLGVPGAIAIILAAGVALRGPAWIGAFNQTLKIILDYRQKRREVFAKIERKKEELTKAVGRRKTKQPSAGSAEE